MQYSISWSYKLLQFKIDQFFIHIVMLSKYIALIFNISNCPWKVKQNQSNDLKINHPFNKTFMLVLTVKKKTL